MRHRRIPEDPWRGKLERRGSIEISPQNIGSSALTNGASALGFASTEDDTHGGKTEVPYGSFSSTNIAVGLAHCEDTQPVPFDSVALSQHNS